MPVVDEILEVLKKHIVNVACRSNPKVYEYYNLILSETDMIKLPTY